MIRAYSDGGNSWRAIEPGWDLSGGEIVFDHDPTQEELSIAFPGRRVNQEKLAWDLIKAERDRRIQSGGFKVGDKWFHSDTFSRTQQIVLYMMGASMPTGIEWKTMDGAMVEMTPALAEKIFKASAASDRSIFSAAEAHKAAMESCADPFDYDYLGGWPQAFGE